MQFNVYVKNINARIENIVHQEARRHGCLLRHNGNVNANKIFLFKCKCIDDLENLVETLETDKSVEVIHVEDAMGRFINFRQYNNTTLPTIYDYGSLALLPG